MNFKEALDFVEHKEEHKENKFRLFCLQLSKGSLPPRVPIAECPPLILSEGERAITDIYCYLCVGAYVVLGVSFIIHFIGLFC